MVKKRQFHCADLIRLDNNAIISHVGQIFKDRIQFFVGEEQAAAEKNNQPYQRGKHKIQLILIHTKNTTFSADGSNIKEEVS